MVSTMSIISCLSSMAQLILLLLPVPRSIMMCLFLQTGLWSPNKWKTMCQTWRRTWSCRGRRARTFCWSQAPQWCRPGRSRQSFCTSPQSSRVSRPSSCMLDPSRGQIWRIECVTYSLMTRCQIKVLFECGKTSFFKSKKKTFLFYKIIPKWYYWVCGERILQKNHPITCFRWSGDQVLFWPNVSP